MSKIKTIKKLSRQVIRPTVSIILVAMIILIGVILRSNFAQIKYLSSQVAENTLRAESEKIRDYIQHHIDHLDALKVTIEAEYDGKYLMHRDRELLNARLNAYQQQNSNLYATFVVFEGNKFDGKNEQYKNTEFSDDTGEYKAWITKDGIKMIQDASNLDYYQIPKKTGKRYVTNPYLYTINGKEELIITITMPIKKDNEFIGAIGCDIFGKGLAIYLRRGKPLRQTRECCYGG